jgi:hypothetical protein
MAASVTGYGIASLPIATAPIAGSPPVLSVAYTLDASYGSYALTGQSITFTFTQGFSLTASSGSYALTGQDITITRGFLLSPQNGLYSLTGQAVDITYTPFTPPVTGPTQYFIEIRSFTESRRI